MINKGTMDPKRSMVPFVDTCRCFGKKLQKGVDSPVRKCYSN